ncbi:hypothetical protein AB0442_31980 [Kitasatospora sp. NPDC085895]|uniref:hypothetical protein n=1 Tax=Kitasatospora sp. NPDC085895 TaxID=3155057 RepID=UPI00344C2F04
MDVGEVEKPRKPGPPLKKLPTLPPAHELETLPGRQRGHWANVAFAEALRERVIHPLREADITYKDIEQHLRTEGTSATSISKWVNAEQLPPSRDIVLALLTLEPAPKAAAGTLSEQSQAAESSRIAQTKRVEPAVRAEVLSLYSDALKFNKPVLYELYALEDSEEVEQLVRPVEHRLREARAAGEAARTLCRYLATGATTLRAELTASQESRRDDLVQLKRLVETLEHRLHDARTATEAARTLCRYLATGTTALRAELTALHAEHDNTHKALNTAQSSLATSQENLRNDLVQLKRLVETLEHRLHDARTATEAARTLCRYLATGTTALRAELTALHAEHDNTHKALNTAQSSLASTIEAEQELRGRLARSEAQARRDGSTAERLTAENSRLRREAAGLRESERLAGKEARAARTAAERTGLQLQESLQREAALRARLEAQARAGAAREEVLNRALADCRGALAHAQADLVSARGSLAAQLAIVADLKEEIGEYGKEMRYALALNHDLEQRLSTAHAIKTTPAGDGGVEVGPAIGAGPDVGPKPLPDNVPGMPQRRLEEPGSQTLAPHDTPYLNETVYSGSETMPPRPIGTGAGGWRRPSGGFDAMVRRWIATQLDTRESGGTSTGRALGAGHTPHSTAGPGPLAANGGHQHAFPDPRPDLPPPDLHRALPTAPAASAADAGSGWYSISYPTGIRDLFSAWSALAEGSAAATTIPTGVGSDNTAAVRSLIAALTRPGHYLVIPRLLYPALFPAPPPSPALPAPRPRPALLPSATGTGTGTGTGTTDARHHDDASAVCAAFTRILTDDVLRRADDTRDWSRALPYTLARLAHHATRAGLLDQFLTDADYLVHASPSGLAPCLDHARNDTARLNAAVYRARLHLHDNATPSTRRQILALDAARAGAHRLHRELSRRIPPGDWAPHWATGSAVGPAHPGTGTGTDHTRPVSTAACTMLNGRSVAVTGGGDGTLRVWDLDTGQPAGPTITAHTGTEPAVACTVLNGRPIAVTNSWDTTAHVWDLDTGRPVGEPLTGHTDRVSAVACTVIGGQPVAVTGSYDYTLRMWDLTSGQPIGRPIPTTGWVLDLACTTRYGSPIAVTTTEDGSIRIWHLNGGHPWGTSLTTHDNTVFAVACTVLDDRPVAVTGSDDNTVRIWDLSTRQPIGEPLTTTGTVRTLACTVLDGRPVAVTADTDNTVHIWDLTTQTATATIPVENPNALAITDTGDLVIAFHNDIAHYRRQPRNRTIRT